MKKIWARRGTTFMLCDATDHVATLNPGIYECRYDDKLETFQLHLTQDAFSFPYKVYGKDDIFIDRVLKTWVHTTGNLGVLMNGVKGTGKTVTAKQVCNRINIPVVMVSEGGDNSYVAALSSFLNEIPGDIVVVFDEFEKIFPEKYGEQPALLNLMDGVFQGNAGRRMFLMTTNEVRINQNFLERPGRIRYIRTYDDLPLEVIEEIVDDLLQYPQFRKDCIRFLSELSIITIDIVKSVVEEVNIHCQAPQEFKDVFNVKETTPTITITQVDSKGKELVLYHNLDKHRIHPTEVNKVYIGKYLHVYDDAIGRIKGIRDGHYLVQVENEDRSGFDGEIVTMKMEFHKEKHRAFHEFAF